MSKTIKFTPDYRSGAGYREALSEAITDLEKFSDELETTIEGLATTGKWKAWSDSIPVGGEFHFTNEMLIDTGDANVDAIIA